MPTVIYAGLRNPARDQAIVQALASRTAAEVAEEFSLTTSTIYAAKRRFSNLKTFCLQLVGGGVAALSPSARWRRPASGAQPSAPTGTTAAPSATSTSRPGS